MSQDISESVSMASVIERTLKGGAGFFAANVIRRGFGFLFVVVASRVLGPAEFGVLALGLSVMGIARNFAAFGLPNTIQRFLSGDGEDRSGRLYGVILLVGTVTAVITTVVLYASAPWAASFFEEPRLASPLRVLSLGVVLVVGSKLCRGVLQAQEQVKQIVAVDTVRNAAKVGLLLPVFLWAQTATGAAWAIFGSFGAAFLVVVTYVRRIDLRPVWSTRGKDIRRILGYTAPLFVVGFGYFLTAQTDRLMLGWLSDSAEVGIYTVTSKLALIMTMLQQSLISIFKPIASEAYREGKRGQMHSSYLFVGKWVGAVNGGLLLIFAGMGYSILQIFGAEYASSTTYYVLIILSSLYYFATWIGPTASLLLMSDSHRVEFVNTSIFVVVNIILNYIFIAHYGAVGAAFATLFSGVIRNLIQALEIYYWKRFSPTTLYNVLLLVLTFSVVLIIMITSTMIARFFVMVIGVIAISSALVFVSTSEELQSVKDLINKSYSKI